MRYGESIISTISQFTGFLLDHASFLYDDVFLDDILYSGVS